MVEDEPVSQWDYGRDGRDWSPNRPNPRLWAATDYSSVGYSSQDTYDRWVVMSSETSKKYETMINESGSEILGQ